MTTVACVGICVRDLIFSVPALPSGPGKLQATARYEVGGGPAANAAVTVVLLGGQARFISAVGNDVIGSEITSELEGFGVDTSLVRVVSGRQSPISAVVVDESGERAIVNHTDQALLDEAGAPGKDDLSGVDAVLVDVRWHRGAVSALRWAAANGLPGVVDFDVGWADPGPIVDAASHLLFSARALRSISDERNLEKGLRAVAEETDGWVGVTDGGNGSYWLDAGVLHHAEAFEVEVVDTTGAGDVFHGAFALEIAAKNTVEKAIRLATAASALSCTGFGGRSGIPSRNQVESFLEERE